MRIEIKRVDNKLLFIKDNEIIYWGGLILKGLKNFRQLNKSDTLISEIKFKFRFPFKLIYNICLTRQQRQISLVYKNIFKPCFTCNDNLNNYELIPHKGLKTSIFKNGKQIGYYEHKKIEYMGKNVIFLIIDKEFEQDIIFSFILAIEGDFKNDYSTVSFDIGNFGPEIKPFDNNWRPL